MNLSQEERDRFAAYCRDEAESCKALAQQMEKITVPEVMKKSYLMKAAAFAFVARELSLTMSDTIEVNRGG